MSDRLMSDRQTFKAVATLHVPVKGGGAGFGGAFRDTEPATVGFRTDGRAFRWDPGDEVWVRDARFDCPQTQSDDGESDSEESNRE